VLAQPLDDDVDAITNWRDSLKPPAVIAWRSVRDHGTGGVIDDRSIILDAAATNGYVRTETRRNGVNSPADGLSGIKKLEVDFDADVSGCYIPGVMLQDANSAMVYAPSNEYLQAGGTTLVLEFMNYATGDSTLPDIMCYKLDLSANIPCLMGDKDCMVRSIVGDVVGHISGYGNGVTNMTDAAAIRAKFLGGAVPVGEDVRFDVIPNASINMTDSAYVRNIAFNGGLGTATCP
jgi:hypothetical protein